MIICSSTHHTDGHDEPLSTSEPPTTHPLMVWSFYGVMQCLKPKWMCPRLVSLVHNSCSKTRWFTGFYNSHHVSHFIIIFINVRAEISIAEIHVNLCDMQHHPMPQSLMKGLYFNIPLAQCCNYLGVHPSFIVPHPEGGEATTRMAFYFMEAISTAYLMGSPNRLIYFRLNNDPSMGSPMETLLQLLLHLNDKV